MSIRIRVGVFALAAIVAACDRPAPTAGNEEPANQTEGSPASAQADERAVMDRLARRFARALADPAFRTNLKAELDRSPFVEHKLQLQSFLRGRERQALKEVARLNASSEAELESDTRQAIPLEIYFPVPAHRASWTGGPEILVASAKEDREAPVAYDIQGRRQVLSPDSPPATPVLAVVPVETEFSQVAEATCTGSCSGGGGGGTPVTGLYMTYAHFVQDFEGWFKGDPEFEIHVLGQAGTSDSLSDYQCAGGSAGGPYRFDQNDLDWSGSVLLFSQSQLNSYKAAHPNQNFRIFAVEDDDTGCVLKFDAARFKSLIGTMQTEYPNVTGAKDTTSGLIKIIKRANALQKILQRAYSFITTQDDMIGNAIEDDVVGRFYSGANWIVKGEQNVTNGWINLQMR